jgi:hypothetical protein
LTLGVRIQRCAALTISVAASWIKLGLASPPSDFFIRNPNASGGAVGFPGGKTARNSFDCLGGNAVPRNDVQARTCRRLRQRALEDWRWRVVGCWRIGAGVTFRRWTACLRRWRGSRWHRGRPGNWRRPGGRRGARQWGRRSDRFTKRSRRLLLSQCCRRQRQQNCNCKRDLSH